MLAAAVAASLAGEIIVEWMLMPLRRYADFSGRSRRMEFWMWVLFQLLVGIGFTILMIAVGGSAFLAADAGAMATAGIGIGVLWLLQAAFSLGTFIPYLAVTVRRLHDTNRSGWWILAPVVPYVASIIAMIAAAATGGPDSGSVVAVGLIAIIGMLAAFVLGIVLLVFMFLEGTRGPNKYGPDPKQPTPAEIFA